MYGIFINKSCSNVEIDMFQNESAAILKIKADMQEEAKRFEKDSEGPSDYFMP